MRLVLDACVLFPEAMRAVLLGHAAAGGFEPLWSPRIIGEWLRAVDRQRGPEAAAAAAISARLMDERFPTACVTGWEALEDATGLPDAADAHVIAAARAGGADGVLTLNIRDFPLRVMGAAGLARLHPDAFLVAEYAPGGPLDAVLDAVEAAAPPSARGAGFRTYLKRSWLPRLAKARAAGSVPTGRGEGGHGA
jgi:hypothetical protein